MAVTRDIDATMDADSYLSWRERRGGPERFELFDGRVHAMGAERAIHARAKYAATRALERAIATAGLPCEAMVDGMAVRVDEGTVFEPDALVRCGERLPDDALVVSDPLIVVEVASPSTQRIDALLKLTRYFRNPSVAHYLIIMPDDRSVVHHRRGDSAIETTIHARGAVRLDPPGLDLVVEELLPAPPR